MDKLGLAIIQSLAAILLIVSCSSNPNATNEGDFSANTQAEIQSAADISSIDSAVGVR